MGSLFDPCCGCQVMKFVDNGSCPLPVCLRDAYEGIKLGDIFIETVILWEKGLTVERIAEFMDDKFITNVYRRVRRWRSKKRELGLLI